MKSKCRFILQAVIILSVFQFNVSAQLPKLAYIYAHDHVRADQYNLFINNYGYTVDVLDTTDIPGADLDAYRMILIGENTGYTNKWASQAVIDNIVNSGKPILGLGEGGYAFFGKLGLHIGYPHGNHDSATSIFVTLLQHQVFKTPYPITIPNDSLLKIYFFTCPRVAIAQFTPTPEIIGSDPSNHANYFLVNENLKYFLWGFDNSPNSLTGPGKNLMINIIKYIREPDGINENPGITTFFKVFPNPAVDYTSVSYNLKTASNIKIRITDITGNDIKYVINESQSIGYHQQRFDVAGFPAGIYFVILQTSQQTETKILVISK